MTTVQMECFLEAAQCLNFTTAAEHLYMTQPALSKQISNLERQLDVKLFLRGKNTVLLTPVGRTLYQDLSEVYGGYTRMLSHVQQVKQGIYGQLDIALQEDQKLNDEIIIAIQNLLKDRPYVKINLSHMHLKQMHMGLINNSIDVAVELSHFEAHTPQIESLCIENEPEYLIIPSALKLDSPGIRSADDFQKIVNQVPLIMLDEENFETPAKNSLGVLLTQRQSGFSQNNQIRYSSSIGAIPLLVIAGLGATIGNNSRALRDDPHVTFLKGLEERRIEKAIIWNKENQNPLLPIFLDLVKQELGSSL